MAAKAPIVLYGPRGQRLAYASHNRLIPAATQNADRKQIQLLDCDFHRGVTALGRRTLLSLGRNLYWVFPALRRAVRELCEYASSTFLPEYRGENKEWKKPAERKLYLHDRFCDIAGRPYNMRNYRRLVLLAGAVDGDMGTLYLNIGGRPYLQIIPGHRIASRQTEETVIGGRYDGKRLVDGVITDDYSTPLAYRVLLGSIADFSNYIDVPAENMRLHFVPHFPGQLRGLSELGLVAWDAQDRFEWRRWEMLAQKNGASRNFQIHNEWGEPPPGAEEITAGDGDSAGHPSGLWFEQIDGGLNSYFKSSDPNSKIEAIKFDRPSQNQQTFDADTVREILIGIGSSYDFTVNPTKIGGHSGRVLLEKFNRNLCELQDLMLEPACRDFDLFRLGTWIDQGELPVVDDFWELEYQGPSRWSGDRKYDLEADIEEVKANFSSRAAKCRARSEDELDVAEASERDTDNFYESVKRIATKHDRPIEEVITLMRPPTPNGLAAPKPDSQGDPQKDNTANE